MAKGTKSSKTNLTIGKIVKIEPIKLERMSTKRLTNILKQLQNTTNKRVRRLLKTDYDSKAVENLLNTGGLISTKGKKTKNQLIKEITRGQKFLRYKSSSIQGIKEIRRTANKRLKEVLGNDKVGDTNTTDKIWEYFEKLKELDPTLIYVIPYQDVLGTISEYLENTNKTGDDILIDLQERLDNVYRQQQEQYEDEDFNDLF